MENRTKTQQFLNWRTSHDWRKQTAEFDGAICVAHLLLRRLFNNLKLDFL
jgi:hypothetical protein